MVTSIQQQITVSLRKDQIEALQALVAERSMSLDELSAQLMAEGGGVESVSWDQVKREKA